VLGSARLLDRSGDTVHTPLAALGKRDGREEGQMTYGKLHTEREQVLAKDNARA